MPSTDVDGSVLVILSAAEARRVYDHLHEIAAVAGAEHLTPTDRNVISKIARDLNLPVNIDARGVGRTFLTPVSR